MANLGWCLTWNATTGVTQARRIYTDATTDDHLIMWHMIGEDVVALEVFGMDLYDAEEMVKVEAKKIWQENNDRILAGEEKRAKKAKDK